MRLNQNILRLYISMNNTFKRLNFIKKIFNFINIFIKIKLLFQCRYLTPLTICKKYSIKFIYSMLLSSFIDSLYNFDKSFQSNSITIYTSFQPISLSLQSSS
ncbi:hypothetical protein PPERSA_03566 [Pseudocohnilembus persalinus]|uniref:Uncharacterized protein n=1 Tax=Pseudocohnilembus persalinus TaxID=266149 RepID=A0A0V0QQ45_PSEPJ|nr:hypothetical protein PPERSA_03566 [Pseudocohnilembus persalinus]|eukprot:KRX04326.1 hypothetical protein PPERSA_03566 [Pseudocohnilembus persalinus]